MSLKTTTKTMSKLQTYEDFLAEVFNQDEDMIVDTYDYGYMRFAYGLYLKQQHKSEWQHFFSRPPDDED